MEQLYLFSDEKHRQELEDYEVPEGVEKTISEMDDKKCWTVRFCMKGDNIDNAKVLSGIDENICSKFDPRVLVCGCSAFYNKRLYPLINTFERNLRCLLYRKSAMTNDKQSKQNIDKLEEMDFGKIFDMLFTDDTFITDCKKKVNNASYKYTKEQIVETIKNLNENVLWDSLLGKDAVPELRTKFDQVRNRRNDVMHAHNIHTKDYLESRRLFGIINMQLEKETDKIITRENRETAELQGKFNETLHEAVKEQGKTKVLHFNWQKLDDRINKVIDEIYEVRLKKEEQELYDKLKNQRYIMESFAKKEVGPYPDEYEKREDGQEETKACSTDPEQNNELV